MSLKNEIDKMSQNNKNTNQIKNNLNNVIVQNGGSTSKSLAEIPNNLESMIKKNYKKIATGNCNISVPSETGQVVDIPLNLNFIPKNVYIRIKSDAYDIEPRYNYIFYIKAPYKGEICVTGYNNGYFNTLTAKNFIISNQKVSFTTSNQYYERNNCKVINWVAIG